MKPAALLILNMNRSRLPPHKIAASAPTLNANERCSHARGAILCHFVAVVSCSISHINSSPGWFFCHSHICSVLMCALKLLETLADDFLSATSFDAIPTSYIWCSFEAG